MKLLCLLALVALVTAQRRGPPPPPENFQECMTKMNEGPPEEIRTRMEEHRKNLTKCLVEKTTLGSCAMDDATVQKLEDLHKTMSKFFSGCIAGEKADGKCTDEPSMPPPPFFRGPPNFGGNSQDSRQGPPNFGSFPRPPPPPPGFGGQDQGPPQFQEGQGPPPPPHPFGHHGGMMRQMIQQIADENARQCFIDNRPMRGPPGRGPRTKRHPPHGHGPGCFRPFCECSAMEKCEAEAQRIKDEIANIMKEKCRCLTGNSEICDQMSPPPPPPCFDPPTTTTSP